MPDLHRPVALDYGTFFYSILVELDLKQSSTSNAYLKTIFVMPLVPDVLTITWMVKIHSVAVRRPS